MTEKEKRDNAMLYNANYDNEIINDLDKCKDICFEFNQIKPTDYKKREEVLKGLFGKVGNILAVQSPFWCDFGYNIEIGKNFYANHALTILDGAKVKIGDNVFIAPNCCLSTAGHPIDYVQRNEGLEFAYPITIGNDVWIGANVTVLPGVTIGNNCVIGAGSVVTKDIPSNCIAYGNPCKKQREITEDDKNLYKGKYNVK